MNDNFWHGLRLASVALLVLLSITVPFTDRQSAEFVIIVLSAIHLLVAIILLSALIHLDWDPFAPFRT